ncbi:MAG TPA: SDR family oxidoreductase [Hyphomicrobiaceae bacterium]|nr:SDR family oxidoreductase [Hyphomicrobiaceae bacterium]
MQIHSASAFVTGANRGIGRALVQRLLADGAKRVYGTARTQDEADKLAALDNRLTGIVMDVTQPSQIAAAAAQARDVTLLINNAGVLDFGNLLEVDRAKVDRNFATNFYGTLDVTRAFAPVLEANGGGTIVNLLTLVALASMPGLSVYNASKAAAWSMTQSWRATLAAKNVKVMGVFPGAVDTDMLAGVDMPKTSPADIAAAICAGLADDREDVFPDAMSAAVYEQWKTDHKSVERQFALM